jgi:hypothetical protein
MRMQICPFCKTPYDESGTICQTCGSPLSQLLPSPTLEHKTVYLGLSIFSTLLGLSACLFTYFPSLYMKSLILIIASLGLASFTLEKVRGKTNTLTIKIMAVVGLVLGVLGYIFFMFIHSNVPGCGYTM